MHGHNILTMLYNIVSTFNKNSMECGVSPVSALSHSRAKRNNWTKTDTADDAEDHTGTKKVMHMSRIG